MLVPTIMSHEAPSIIPTWADGSDTEIWQALQKHYHGVINLYDYWTIGDVRKIHLKPIMELYLNSSHPAHEVQEMDIYMVLSEKGGKYLEDGKTECVFQVDNIGLWGDNAGLGVMNVTNQTTGGWETSERRAWCNNEYFKAFPEVMQQVFKPFINQSGNKVSNGVINLVETVDHFAYRSEKEMFGVSTHSYPGEGEYVEYYKTSINRIKRTYLDNNRNSLGTRSIDPSYSGDLMFVSFGIDDKLYSNPNTSALFGIAPFGVI